MTEPQKLGEHISVGILTVSDTCSVNSSLDKSGPTAIQLLREAGCTVTSYQCVSDDKELLTSTLLNWISTGSLDVIFTLGGTGLTNRDITPDTLLSLIDRNRRVKGLEHSLYKVSLDHTPMAALSRFVVGIRDQVLMIALPGSSRAVAQCIPVVIPVLKHAVAQIKGWQAVIDEDHQKYAYNNPLESGILSSPTAIVNRSRQSPFPMVSVEDAWAKIFDVAQLTFANAESIEAVHYQNALGRILARSLQARHQIPPYDASLMDGYATRFADGAGEFRVLGTVCAGDPKVEPSFPNLLKPCYRVSTGGPIPAGFDCVVPVEHTRLVGTRSGRLGDPHGPGLDEEDLIEVVQAPRQVGEFIRPAGFDLTCQDQFKRGLKLGAPELGLLAAAGLLAAWPVSPGFLVDQPGEPVLPEFVVEQLTKTSGYLPCLKQLRIGLLSTGNEIVDETVPTATDLIIRDSNRCLIMNLLRQHGYRDLLDFGILRDDVQTLESGFHRILNACDLVITTGGVSMGERDLVARVLTEKFGARIHFGRVFMKPGKPTTFLSVRQPSNPNRNSSVLIFCLPGNPVSAYVTSHLFVLPLLRGLELRPRDQWLFPSIRVRLQTPVDLTDRPGYRRANLTWQSDSGGVSIPYARFEHLGSQLSSRLASCLQSDLLIQLPVQTEQLKRLEAGSVVTAFLIKP